MPSRSNRRQAKHRHAKQTTGGLHRGATAMSTGTTTRLCSVGMPISRRSASAKCLVATALGAAEGSWECRNDSECGSC